MSASENFCKLSMQLSPLDKTRRHIHEKANGPMKRHQFNAVEFVTLKTEKQNTLPTSIYCWQKER